MRSSNGFKQLNAGGLSSKQEHTLQIDGMRGVDLTNSPLFVNKHRASAMSNFIMENNVIQKRNGWTELAQLAGPINGYWQLETSSLVDGVYTTEKHNIFLCGDRFYTVDLESIHKMQDGNFSKPTITPITMNNIQVENEVAYGVVHGEKLYVLCGTFVVITKNQQGSLEATRVQDSEDVFIPTTTTSIGTTNNTVINRKSYDDINMLTKWRYNSLIGDNEEHESQTYQFILDGICTNLDTVSVRVYDESGRYRELSSDLYMVENTYYAVSENNEIHCTLLTLRENFAPFIEGQDNILVKFEVENPIFTEQINGCKFGVLYGHNNLDRLFLSGNPKYPNLVFRSSEPTGDDSKMYFSTLDYIKLGNTSNSITGMTILGDGTLCALKSPSGQEPTIYFIESTMVTATDREGNPIYVNGVAQIEEQYRTKVGTIGEGLVSTSSLQTLAGDTLMLSNNGIYGIVLGSNVATSQRYAKTRSRLINSAIAKERNKLKEAVCYVFDNKYYMCLDDVCYVGDGRYPYKLEDDLNDEYQYEWFVWNNVPARLFFSYNNELYFGTKEGHIVKFENEKYVDTTYKAFNKGEITYDYDTGYFVMHSVHQGSIERLHNDDIMHIQLGDADIYALFLNPNEFKVDKQNNGIVVLKDLKHEYVTQMATYKFYFDNIGAGENLETYTPYIMNVTQAVDEEIDDDKLYTLLKFYKEKTVTGDSGEPETILEEVDLGNGNYRICYKLNASNVITDVKGTVTEDIGGYFITRDVYYKDVVLNGNFYEEYNEDGYIERTFKKDELIFNEFKLRTFTAELNAHDIITYDGLAFSTFGGRFEFNEPINCFFVTGVFNLGSSVYSKSIKQMIIVPDTMLDTEVDFGYETKTNVMYFNAYTGAKFNFDNINFDNLSFESEGFAKAYIKRTRLKNVNFIRFIFKNSSKNNCKVSNLSVVYEFGKKNKGVA